MKRWVERVIGLSLLGASSVRAGEGPKLEPPLRPTRSEVEGTARPAPALAELPSALGGPSAPILEPPRPMREGLPPIYRPSAPPTPGLDGPALMTPAGEAAPPLEGPRALTLETVPEPSALDFQPLEAPKPLERRRVEEKPSPRFEPEPRRRGLFGLFRSQPRYERIDPLPSTSSARNKLPKTMSSTDPATDSALRRKVQAQADRALGRHLRELDVRVVDQKIRIRARADFFWNRRGIRKTLATLPAIQGHETAIEVD